MESMRSSSKNARHNAWNTEWPMHANDFRKMGITEFHGDAE